MFKTLQFIGVVAAMSLGVVVSVTPTAGSVSGPGGQGVPCDVDFDRIICQSPTEGKKCTQPMDVAGSDLADKKLADQAGIDNCNNYWDNNYHRCVAAQQVRVLEFYNCATAPPPPL